jgi:hypothetical protein
MKAVLPTLPLLEFGPRSPLHDWISVPMCSLGIFAGAAKSWPLRGISIAAFVAMTVRFVRHFVLQSLPRSKSELMLDIWFEGYPIGRGP